MVVTICLDAAHKAMDMRYEARQEVLHGEYHDGRSFTQVISYSFLAGFGRLMESIIILNQPMRLYPA
jgi:hypothetical protein